MAVNTEELLKGIFVTVPSVLVKLITLFGWSYSTFWRPILVTVPVASVTSKLLVTLVSDFIDLGIQLIDLYCQ